jgi:hypothetical protein
MKPGKEIDLSGNSSAPQLLTTLSPTAVKNENPEMGGIDTT